ncbi:MAG: DUF1844 domain-containing protein [Planctomycetota bacterium]
MNTYTDSDSAPKPAPRATFQTIVYTMATQAMIALGEIESPISHETKVDLRQAKYLIDSLQVLLDKTKGNLDETERGALINILAEVQMKFVEKND